MNIEKDLYNIIGSETYKLFYIKSNQYFVVMQKAYFLLASIYFEDRIEYFAKENGQIREFKAVEQMLYSESLDNVLVRSFKEIWKYANQIKHNTSDSTDNEFKENYARFSAITFNKISESIFPNKGYRINIQKLTERNQLTSNTCRNVTYYEDEAIQNQNEVELKNVLAFENPSVPICPLCKKPMVLRNGKFGKFYGCINYPTCKQTVNYKKESLEDIKRTSEKFSVNFIARPRSHEACVKFYQSIAVPESILKQVNKNEVIRSNLLPFSHWRLDYIPTNVPIKDSTINMLSLAFKILTRGRITLNSPYLEKKLCKKTEYDDIDNFSFLKDFNNTPNDFQFWFDSKNAEQIFYLKILKNIMGENYYKYVIPQADLGCLTNATEDLGNQRVDFAINDGETKLVIEIDDSTHLTTQQPDSIRDKLLTKSGYKIIRIPSKEVINGYGPMISNVSNILGKYKDEIIDKKDYKEIIISKLSHQIQIAIIQLLTLGLISSEAKLKIDLSAKLNTNFLKYVLEDLNILLNNLSFLCSSDEKFNLTLCNDSYDYLISYNQDLLPQKNVAIITDIIYKQNFVNVIPPFSENCIYTIDENNLTYFLNYIFRKDKFREGQLVAVSNALEGKNSIVLLPTGAGKSIAFQLAGMLSLGITFVVSPLISLMDDQVENLISYGIDRSTQITSEMNYDDKAKLESNISSGDYNTVYIAPERLQIESFRKMIKSLIVDIPIPLFVIDEAHCLSEWGHDFRTSYLNLNRIINNYCTFKGKAPTILALTGTASEGVINDIQHQLNISESNTIRPLTFDRKELHFNILGCSNQNKNEILKKLLNQIPSIFNSDKSTFYNSDCNNDNSGIIFCPHVKGNFGVINVCKYLEDFGYNVNIYAGDASEELNLTKAEWDERKSNVSKEFKRNKFPILVATKAYGMGIDKPNIRFVIHYNMPSSVEGYYQETGRAGRDRRDAKCIMIASLDNFNNELLENYNYKDLNIKKSTHEDDLTRNMYFFNKAFKGVSYELNIVNLVYNIIKAQDANQFIYDFYELKSPIPNDKNDSLESTDLEKAIYRLLCLGVISDYTKQNSKKFYIFKNEFDKEKIIDSYLKIIINYSPGRYNSEKSKIEKFRFENNESLFVQKITEALLNFNYDIIVKGRLQQIRTMRDLVKEAITLPLDKQDKFIRKKIAAVLGSTEEDIISNILESNDCGFAYISKFFTQILPKARLMNIYGQIDRTLESKSDHPGLLFISIMQSLDYKHISFEEFNSRFAKAISYSINEYSLYEETVSEFLAWFLSHNYRSIINKYSEEDYFSLVYSNLDLLNANIIVRSFSNHKEYEKSAAIPFLYQKLFTSIDKFKE